MQYYTSIQSCNYSRVICKFKFKQAILSTLRRYDGTERTITELAVPVPVVQELEEEPANRPITPESEEMDPGLQGLPAGPDMDYVDYASDVLQYKQRFAGYL